MSESDAGTLSEEVKEDLSTLPTKKLVELIELGAARDAVVRSLALLAVSEAQSIKIDAGPETDPTNLQDRDDPSESPSSTPADVSVQPQLLPSPFAHDGNPSQRLDNYYEDALAGAGPEVSLGSWLAMADIPASQVHQMPGDPQLLQQLCIPQQQQHTLAGAKSAPPHSHSWRQTGPSTGVGPAGGGHWPRQQARQWPDQPPPPPLPPPATARPLSPTTLAGDAFRMYAHKVLPCPSRLNHNWNACPYAHASENARRRDPRRFKYVAVSCPYKKAGACLFGENCLYSHGVCEASLHPAKYRTEVCREGAGCRHPVCFFAHTALELRQPELDCCPTPEEFAAIEGVRAHQVRARLPPGHNLHSIIDTAIQEAMVQLQPTHGGGRARDGNAGRPGSSSGIGISYATPTFMRTRSTF